MRLLGLVDSPTLNLKEGDRYGSLAGERYDRAGNGKDKGLQA
jgi:hypothetical protein